MADEKQPLDQTKIILTQSNLYSNPVSIEYQSLHPTGQETDEKHSICINPIFDNLENSYKK